MVESPSWPFTALRGHLSDQHDLSPGEGALQIALGSTKGWEAELLPPPWPSIRKQSSERNHWLDACDSLCIPQLQLLRSSFLGKPIKVDLEITLLKIWPFLSQGATWSRIKRKKLPCPPFAPDLVESTERHNYSKTSRFAKWWRLPTQEEHKYVEISLPIHQSTTVHAEKFVLVVRGAPKLASSTDKGGGRAQYFRSFTCECCKQDQVQCASYKIFSGFECFLACIPEEEFNFRCSLRPLEFCP